VQGEGWRPPGFALVREALQRKGRDFRPYQVEGARWLGRERGAILADSPGLGKTIQLLALLEPEVGRAVVVGPKNAIPEWTAQIREYRPDLRAVKARGRGGMPAPQPGEVCLGTLESLAPAPPELAGALLACDEAHALKGDTAQRDRFCAWSRAALAAGGRVVLLTGTPILNADPTELWRMLDAAGRAEDTLGPLAGLRALFAHEVEALEVPDRSPRAKAAVQRILDQHGARSFAQLPKAERDRALALSYRRVERVRWSGDHSPEVGDRLRRAVLRRTKEQVARDLPPLQRADRAARLDDAKMSHGELASKPLWLSRRNFPLPCGDASYALELVKPEASSTGEIKLIATCLASYMLREATMHLSTYDAARVLAAEERYFREEYVSSSGDLRKLKHVVEMRLAAPVVVDEGTVTVVARTEPGAAAARMFVELRAAGYEAGPPDT
jgi:hypothetical protein